MKKTKVGILILAIALVLYILVPNLSWAEGGAALYKAQCTVCHRPDGAVEPTARVSSVVAGDDEVEWEGGGLEFHE